MVDGGAFMSFVLDILVDIFGGIRHAEGGILLCVHRNGFVHQSSP